MVTPLVHAILGVRGADTTALRRDSCGRIDHPAVMLVPKV